VLLISLRNFSTAPERPKHALTVFKTARQRQVVYVLSKTFGNKLAYYSDF